MARVEHLKIEFANNNWMGPGRHLVHYPVSAGRMLNFVGLLEQDSWIKESWTEPGSLDDLAAAYAGFAARCATSSLPPTTLSNGRYSTVIRCRAGRSAGSHCWATPATRCCHFSARAQRKRSRTARRSPPVSSAMPTIAGRAQAL